MKFRKKPVVIEAFKWTGDMHQTEDPIWIVEALSKQRDAIGAVWITQPPYPVMYIRSLEGVMAGQLGDYIIRGVKGELYPCKPDIFEQTYEPA